MSCQVFFSSKSDKLLFILLENTDNNHVLLRFYQLCKMLQTETATHTDLHTEMLVNFIYHDSFNNLISVSLCTEICF